MRIAHSMAYRSMVAAALLLTALTEFAPAAKPEKEASGFGDVFARQVKIPEDLEGQAGKELWKGSNFPSSDPPRYPHEQPLAGDFALYLVRQTHDPRLGERKAVLTSQFLMLEYIRPAWRYSQNEIGRSKRERIEESITCSVRVYGLTRRGWDTEGLAPTVIFKGLIADAAGGEFAGPWPWRELRSFKKDSLSLADLTYFRDYEKFAGKKNKNGEGRDDRVSWTELGKDVNLGQLWRFNWEYLDMDDPAGGTETVCVSEKVPVRGLVFAKDDWSSSSGLRNHIRTIQLLNFGRLSETQVREMEATEDALPEELALWKRLATDHGE